MGKGGGEGRGEFFFGSLLKKNLTLSYARKVRIITSTPLSTHDIYNNYLFELWIFSQINVG
jgi:hypothetical protein